MWRRAGASLPRLAALCRPSETGLTVGAYRVRPTAGPTLAAAPVTVLTRCKTDGGGGLFGSLRGKLEAAAEQGADLAKAKAGELELEARKRAAELESKASEIGAEAAATAKAKAGAFEAEARRRAAELEGKAIGMGTEGMEAALSKAAGLEAYGQELAQAKLNQLKDLEDRATELSTDATDRLIQTKADIEAFGSEVTENKIKQLKELEAGATAMATQRVEELERQRDQLLADADALNKRVGLAVSPRPTDPPPTRPGHGGEERKENHRRSQWSTCIPSHPVTSRLSPLRSLAALPCHMGQAVTAGISPGQ